MRLQAHDVHANRALQTDAIISCNVCEAHHATQQDNKHNGRGYPLLQFSRRYYI